MIPIPFSAEPFTHVPTQRPKLNIDFSDKHSYFESIQIRREAEIVSYVIVANQFVYTLNADNHLVEVKGDDARKLIKKLRASTKPGSSLSASGAVQQRSAIEDVNQQANQVALNQLDQYIQVLDVLDLSPDEREAKIASYRKMPPLAQISEYVAMVKAVEQWPDTEKRIKITAYYNGIMDQLSPLFHQRLQEDPLVSIYDNNHHRIDILRLLSEMLFQFNGDGATGSDVFAEADALAWTQHPKNVTANIPQAGSKGAYTSLDGVQVEKLNEIKQVFADFPEIAVKIVNYFRRTFPLSTNGKRNSSFEEDLRRERDDLWHQFDAIERDHPKQTELFRQAIALISQMTVTNYFYNYEGKKSTNLTVKLDLPNQQQLDRSYQSDPQLRTVLEHSPINKFYAKKKRNPTTIMWSHAKAGFFGVHIRYAPYARGGLRDMFPSRSTYSTLGALTIVTGFLDIVRILSNHHSEDDTFQLGPDVGTAWLPNWVKILAGERMEVKHSGTRMTGADAVLGGFDHNRNNAFRYEEVEESTDPLVPLNVDKGNNVTSQGVMQMFDNMVQEIGILKESGKKVSVVMTGGTDGDVGGGNIRIFIQKYGKKGKIKVLMDGTAILYDEVGLNQEELMRLYRNNLPLSAYNPDSSLRSKHSFTVRLENQGFVHLSQTQIELLDLAVLAKAGKRTEDGGIVIDPVTLRDLGWFITTADAVISGGDPRNKINPDNHQYLFVNGGQKPRYQIFAYGANVVTDDRSQEWLEQEYRKRDLPYRVGIDWVINDFGVRSSNGMEVNRFYLFGLDGIDGPTYMEFVRANLTRFREGSDSKYFNLRQRQKEAARKDEAPSVVTQIAPEIPTEILKIQDMIKDFSWFKYWMAGYEQYPGDMIEQGIAQRGDTIIEKFLLRYFQFQKDGADYFTIEDLYDPNKIPPVVLQSIALRVMASAITLNSGLSFIQELYQAGRSGQKRLYQMDEIVLIYLEHVLNTERILPQSVYDPLHSGQQYFADLERRYGALQASLKADCLAQIRTGVQARDKRFELILDIAA